MSSALSEWSGAVAQFPRAGSLWSQCVNLSKPAEARLAALIGGQQHSLVLLQAAQ